MRPVGELFHPVIPSVPQRSQGQSERREECSLEQFSVASQGYLSGVYSAIIVGNGAILNGPLYSGSDCKRTEEFPEIDVLSFTESRQFKLLLLMGSSICV